MRQDWAAQSVNALVTAFARWAAEAAGVAMASLAHSLGGRTEPRFSDLAGPYDQMLALALLLAAAFICCALVERLVGGPSGAGWNVVPRTVVAIFFAVSGLSLAAHVEHAGALIAQVWAAGLGQQGNRLQGAAGHLVSTSSGLPLGSLAGLIATALLALLLALVVYLELMLRAALILVTVTFIPLVSVMAIWPRLASAARHLTEFLIGLFLSKFVIATAISVGFTLIVQSLRPKAGDKGMADPMVLGVVILAVAALSPLILFQGLRFGQAPAGHLARNWSSRAGALPAGAAAALVARLRPRATRAAGSLLARARRSVRRRRP